MKLAVGRKVLREKIVDLVLSGYLHEGVFGEIHLMGDGVYDMAGFMLGFANEFVMWDSCVGIFFISSLNDFFNWDSTKVDVFKWCVFVAGSASKDAEIIVSRWCLIVDDGVK